MDYPSIIKTIRETILVTQTELANMLGVSSPRPIGGKMVISNPRFVKDEGKAVEITGGIMKVLYPGEKKPRMYEFSKALLNGYFVK